MNDSQVCSGVRDVSANDMGTMLGTGCAPVACGGMSDAALIGSLRTACTGPAGEETPGAMAEAEAPLQELRRRHLPALAVYARLCIGGAYAEALAAEAFRRAEPDLRATFDPEDALRLQLLLAVVHTAASWAVVGRRADLAPGFVAWLDQRPPGSVGHGGACSGRLSAPMTTGSLTRQAVYSLPPRSRALLWHTVVDPADPEDTARLLGLSSGWSPMARKDLLQRLRSAYLTHHTTQADEPCRHLAVLLEATTRPDAARRSGDLDCHLAQCPACSAAHGDLTRLLHQPDVLLAEALLPWGSTAYLKAHRSPQADPAHNDPPPSAPRTSSPRVPQAAPTSPRRMSRAKRRERRAALRSTATSAGAAAGLALIASITSTKIAIVATALALIAVGAATVNAMQHCSAPQPSARRGPRATRVKRGKRRASRKSAAATSAKRSGARSTESQR
ncbi:hypothetical protein OH805_38065 [Streptomyces sp. NBC_00879]|uniref:hypothetical protein n=1 Tax=Streptomyces sp. NBC_00879 TaxID=2975855 RepID=UPI00386E09D1|nr:hypothetical protein OH805_38065 [Streptomyces sp. NBC_00879]